MNILITGGNRGLGFELVSIFLSKGFTVCALHPGRLLTSSGAFDAHMEPHESANKIYKLLVDNKLENGGYYCVETGTIPW